MVTAAALAKFIAAHPPTAVVDVSPDTLTVCSMWSSNGRWGWTVQRIPATARAVSEWLGY